MRCIVIMHLIAILLLSLIEVITEVNCAPFDARSRRLQKSVPITNTSANNTFNSRRRDIYTENSSIWNDSQTKSIERGKVLLPDLDSAGRPHCLNATDDTFCEDIDNYPKSYLTNEIEYSPKEFLNMFGTKEIDGRGLIKPYMDDDLSEERVCGRIPRVIWPKMAKNQANQWIYVVNDVEYTQAVVAEICEKEGKPCAYLDRNLPPGMHSRCRQKYSYKRLLALHPSEKRTYSDTFKFPSCCACYVKSNEILGRSIKSKKKN